jgi:prevent-host-death family protein
MKTATVREVRNAFPSILRRVERGETVTITKRGKPVAAISPAIRRKGRVSWADREKELMATFPEPLKGWTMAGLISEQRD